MYFLDRFHQFRFRDRNTHDLVVSLRIHHVLVADDLDQQVGLAVQESRSLDGLDGGADLAVMLKPGSSLTSEDVLDHLDRSGLSRYDMPEYYLPLNAIPLTASGKILKRDIASQVAEGKLTPVPVRFVPRGDAVLA